MDRNLRNHLAGELNVNHLECVRMSGGDINEAYRLDSDKGSFFLKYSNAEVAPEMLRSEKDGLLFLRSQDNILVPQVIRYGTNDHFAYLVLDYVEEGRRTHSFWEKFGQQLAQLHKVSHDHFGWPGDNFIGLLSQSNTNHDDWAAFYREERIMPQVHLAHDRSRLNRTETRYAERLCKRLHDLCPVESPSLIHGDLWAGNFLCSQSQDPYLIDPSVSFAHREMDLAMSKLFGGFQPLFYQVYHEIYPVTPGFTNRTDVYQLYYLLVHLNLFGSAYYPQVVRTLKKYGST